MNEIVIYAIVVLMFIGLFSIFIYAALYYSNSLPYSGLTSGSQGPVTVSIGPVEIFVGSRTQLFYISVVTGLLLLILALVLIYSFMRRAQGLERG